MDQFANGINIPQSLMEQPCNEHEASKHWDLEVMKVQALPHLKTAPKVLKMMDKLSCLMQANRPKAKAPKGPLPFHKQDQIMA